MTHTSTEIAAMIERAQNILLSTAYGHLREGISVLTAMLRDVAAERDRYRDLAAKTHKANMATMGAEVRAESERDQLAAMVEKLRGYARHRQGCYLVRWDLDCTCGLSDVLKEGENG